MTKRTYGTVLAVAALAFGACGDEGGGGGGGGESSGGGSGGETLTIYSSLPLQGAARTQSLAAVYSDVRISASGPRKSPAVAPPLIDVVAAA